jgi:UDP-glucuronate 4-epimerase
MSVLVTGAAGFVGYHVSRALLDRGETVIGIDSLNDYYDPALKRARLALLSADRRFEFREGDLSRGGVLDALPQGIDRIVHLAAQAGVRYSIEAPLAYVHANLEGHTRVLELARARGIANTVYASSSSVYGGNAEAPFSEGDRADDPVSFYGATKKSCELLSQSYARLYGLSLTGLRFFTVYGRWGRPDMAYWIFARAILRGEPIRIFNEGRMGRDFTHIDDVTAGVLAALDRPASRLGLPVPHRIYNLGGDHPTPLMDMIATLEAALGRKAAKEFLPMQQGDVERTWADLTRSRAELGYDSKVPLSQGLPDFAGWFREEGVAFS